MKLNRLPFLCAFFFLSFTALAQNNFSILFKNGTLTPRPNVRHGFIDSLNKRIARVNNKSLVVLQFENIPTQDTRKILSAHGVELLEYVSGNAYTATLTGDLITNDLMRARVRSIVELSPQQKMSSHFDGGIIPSWAVKISGTVDAWISFPKTFTVTEVIDQLKHLNVEILSRSYQSYRIISIRIASGRVMELASLPFIEYIQPAPPQDQPLNFNSRFASRANVLNASIANGGKGLNGEGVVVGIGDNSDIQQHIDFAGRLINRSPLTHVFHGTHVSGILSGSGNVYELYRGYAPKATIVSQAFSGILSNAATYVKDYGMVITNNSYGDILECDYYGTYDLVSRALDQMAFDLPHLQNVFAVGNSGASTCPPFALGYRTVLGGYQTAKNVLTVGVTSDSGLLALSSSRGPAKDGRVKPDVVAMGRLVASSVPFNTYSFSSGTSMAAPAVSGGLALLYQRYRQLSGGANPKNGLMKAILCNGAVDRGNAGPDYQYGYGWLNLLRSIDILEQNRYFSANSTNGSINNHNISVPANTAQLKVMLYWNDPAASLISTNTLVNDLDLQVTNPSSAIIFPKILDTTSFNVGNIATTGPDHVNNMEQVIIDHPEAGNYALKVTGTTIAQNPMQEYFLVYDVIPVQLQLTAPTGGIGLVPGEQTKISWEAYGFSSGTVTLEFSGDNGTSWTTIASGIDINRTIYSWWVPDVTTAQALVRITKEGTGETSTSHSFPIVPCPVISLAPVQCEGYINITWPAAAGVTDYEVMMLQGEEMKTVAFTSANTYTFSGLSPDSVYWVSVRARKDGREGRRSVAISSQPNTGTCTGSISDNDLKIDAILSPASGRKFTSTQLSASSVVSIRIKNLDDAPVSNFDVKYAVNGGTWITESVTTAIAAGGTYTHNFSMPADFSATGNYNLAVVVKNNIGDLVTANDTAIAIIKHLDNQPINLTGHFMDDLETAVVGVYQKNTLGIAGIERYDFTPSTVYGRVRTFINSGIAYSGSKALTLDADRVYPPGNTNFLYATFNLSSYDALNADLRFDFRFLNHGQLPDVNNKVWIRGNDTQPWVKIYDLDSNQNIQGEYKKTASIELSDVLLTVGQNFGSSFQIRWGQHGQSPATERFLDGGYTFDDIHLYQALNDMQLKSVDAPTIFTCGLTSNSTIKVSVRNSVNATVTNVPIKYRVNNGSWVTETIPSIPGNATVQYSFSSGADLSAFSSYTIHAVVDLNTDSFRENDTLSITVRNSPVIASFPYLQNFEANDGHWFTGGIRSSWEYGTPASIHINKAASGAKAWKTRLAGGYNDNEYSYLYSPCFDLSSMTAPALSFSVALDIEDCGPVLCDGAWVEYSTNDSTWIKLGMAGNGTNWYNKTLEQLWSVQNYQYWHVATTSLPKGFNRLRLRFVFKSDPGVLRDGIAVDDIHIYDSLFSIYDGVTMTSAITQNLSGNNWVHFTNGGKVVASVHPNNQNPGSTSVQAYIFNGAIRNNTKQYYHNRNITVKPANSTLADSVTLRFYFLDSETDSLLKAAGCSTCSKPYSAYEMGISKYTDPDISFENGTITDNQQGWWSYIASDKVIKVPFGKGYYAEYKVKDFSEFWLSNGGFDHSTPLPVKLIEVTAKKAGNNVFIQWKVSGETDVVRYEVEVARGNEQLQASQFIKIGEIASLGNTDMTRTYDFTDNEVVKSGVQYYRIKIINADGTFRYSPLRSVVFDEAVLWKIYPNPSKGNFQLIYQLSTAEVLSIRVYDQKGRLVQEASSNASGLLEKLNINLSAGNFPSGVYLLRIRAAGKAYSFKLTKI